jgi:pilus assembly protein CpaF
MSQAKATQHLSIEMVHQFKAWLERRASEILATDGKGKELRERLENALRQAMEESQAPLAEKQRQAILESLRQEMLGFGPIQPLLDDPTITEVMINGLQDIYVERGGKIEATSISFASEAEVTRLVQKIVAPLGKRVDAENPTVDARLPDGSRVNVVVPPTALDGTAITIRKFAGDMLKAQDLIRYGSMTEAMAEYLSACVLARLNILVSGGTGSGKTTLLNVLSGFVPKDDRIVTIEDSAELKLDQDHVVRLEGRPPNVDGLGEISIRHLVKNSLRMRPERIIVGEVRGGEALDMLQAMNTGHDGSMTTLHSNSPRDAIARLETLVLMAGLDLPLIAIRKQIASAIDLIVQQTRLGDGSRKITSIAEVVGMEGDVVTLSELFRYEKSGVDAEGRSIGQLVATGIRSMFDQKLKAAGLQLGANVFSKPAGQAEVGLRRGRAR